MLRKFFNRFLWQGMLCVALGTCALCFVSCNVSAAEKFAGVGENWSRFRGPNGTGIAADVVFAAEWTETDYLWKIELPGQGSSSPVGWGDRVFVTCGDAETGAVTLLCLDAVTGERLWARTFSSTVYSKHASNGYATTTPAVDAKHVYITWASPEQTNLVAVTHEGKPAWERQLKGYSGQHGFASSPMVVGDLVCMQCDQAERAFLLGVEAGSGKVRWRAERPVGKTTYSTPCVIPLPDGGHAVISHSTTGGIGAVEVQSGEQLWQLPEDFRDHGRCVGSPLLAGNLVFGECGQGGGGKLLVAVQLPSQAGELPTERFRLTKNVPYVPSPIVDGSLLFLWHDKGTVCCFDLDAASADKPLWTKRVGGNYYGSPIIAGGKLYCVSRAGEMVVLAADREYALLGKTDLGEPSDSTPAVHRGKMYLRTDSSLACLPGQSSL